MGKKGVQGYYWSNSYIDFLQLNRPTSNDDRTCRCNALTVIFMLNIVLCAVLLWKPGHGIDVSVSLDSLDEYIWWPKGIHFISESFIQPVALINILPVYIDLLNCLL